MNERYVIRRANPGDYDAIIRVVDDWWGRPVTAVLPRLFLDHFFATSAIVESGGEMVGFLIAFLSPSKRDEAYIHFVGVHPDHRGAGIAARMYEEFFAFASRSGRVRVRAVTAPINTASIAFHEHLGFTVHRPTADDTGPGTHPVRFERKL